MAAELARNPDERLAALHAELRGTCRRPGRTGAPGLRRPARAAHSHGELRLMTTISSFANAVDVTIAELKLEAFLPADEATAAALRASQS